MVRSKVVVLLFFFYLMLNVLPIVCGGSFFCLRFGMHYVVSFLVLQSS